MKVVLETFPGEGEGEMRAGCDQALGGGQNYGGERDGIPYRAADSDVKLSRQRDMNQGWPRDTSGDSAGPGLNPLQLVVRNEIVGPLLRRINRNRSHRNAI
ncbi:MAG TPA: hypothetical protein VF461_14520 [Gemmatimonadaceae bacterium]